MLRLLKLSINLNEPSVFFFKNIGEIISPSLWSHLVITFFWRSFSISSLMTDSCYWEQWWRWVCTSSSVSSIDRPETVCNISISEVKRFQLHRYCLVLPGWNSTLRFVSCVLNIHTSSCGISSLWNDMASDWYWFWCCCCCCFKKVVSAVVMVGCNFDHLSCHSPKKTLFGL